MKRDKDFVENVPKSYIGEAMQKLTEEKEKGNHPHLVLLTGGKEEPPENWLSTLPELTCFLTGPKPVGQKAMEIAKMPIVDGYQVLYQFKRHTLLKPIYQDTREFPVKSLEFSRLMELREIIDVSNTIGLEQYANLKGLTYVPQEE